MINIHVHFKKKKRASEVERTPGHPSSSLGFIPTGQSRCYVMWGPEKQMIQEITRNHPLKFATRIECLDRPN